MKIIVTGGAGFIGSHIVEALVRRGDEVWVIDNFFTGKKENLSHLKKDINLQEGSILDTELLKQMFKGADAVLHQAAIPSVPRSIKQPLETNNTNIGGTLSVFVAAHEAGVGKVVYASSSSVYGDTPILPKVETMPSNPLSPYAVQKFTGELYAHRFFNLFELKTIGLRYFNVFGPRQDPHSEYAAVIPKFITSIKKGISPVIFGDGTQTRDFTYVKNVVDANLTALEAESGFGEVFNIAAGGQISLNQLIEKLNTIMHTQIKPIYTPIRAGDIKDSFADISKASDILHYVPKVSFEEGLKETIASL